MSSSSALKLAAALLVAVVALSIAVVVLLIQSESTPEPAVRVERPPPPLRAVVAAEDAGSKDEPDATRTERGSAGCGKDARPGLQQLSALRGLSPQSWHVYVPTGYTSDVPLPVVLIAHDLAMTPKEALVSTRFDVLADEHRLILVAPHDPELPPWWERDTTIARTALEGTKDALCVDPKAVFVLGLGAGGRIAENLPCDFEVAGIATSAFRSRQDELCTPASPVPHLHLAPLRDGYNPVEGGAGCSNGHKISLERKEALWRARNVCKDDPPTEEKRTGGTCLSWTCEAPFVSCHLDGGRRWRGMGRRLFDAPGCDPDPADFDHRDVIWEFFNGLLLAKKAAETGGDVGR